MAGQLKLRRGTTSQLANYIGSEGELTYDTALKSLVLHDGVTLGGVKIPYLSNNLVPSAMLPTATELVVGASKIATTAIAQAGVNDTDIMTPKKVKDQVSMGGRVHARVYVSTISGVSTILGSKNILSVVRNSVGVHKITTITAMDDLNFTIIGTASLQNGLGTSQGYILTENLNASNQPIRTINSFEVLTLNGNALLDAFRWGVTVVC